MYDYENPPAPDGGLQSDPLIAPIPTLKPKKSRAWIWVLVALLLLGCGAAAFLIVSNGNDGNSSARMSVVDSSSDNSVMEEVFLDVIQNADIEASNFSSDGLLALGESVCDNFEAGNRWADIVGALVEAGSDAYEAGFLVGTSVRSLCPEHMYMLPG